MENDAALTGPATAVDFGVGFSLSLDYGTTSVHFANGTTVDVAKIEGGWTYKEMIELKIGHSPILTKHHRIETGNCQCFGQTCDGLVTVCFHGRADMLQTHRLMPSSPTLRALKTAAESYVNTKVEDAVVVFPSRPSQSLHKAVDRAASQSSLRLPVRFTASAGELAARATGISGFSSYYDDFLGERLILAVDWIRAALTASLFSEECGLFQNLRSFQSETLGSRYWSAEMKDTVSSELQYLIREPAYASSEDISYHVNAVVVFGEHGHDSRLRAVLKEFLGEHPARDDVLAADKNLVDPVFTASRGTAAFCFDRMQGAETGVLCDMPIPAPIEAREL